MTDRWADVFPHKVEWNHRDDNADERVKLGWQKVERFVLAQFLPPGAIHASGRHALFESPSVQSWGSVLTIAVFAGDYGTQN